MSFCRARNVGTRRGSRDEHRRIDGLLTGPQIKAIRRRLGLTQAEAARLMGGGDNAFSKYERGEVTQSVAMNQLLLVLAAVPDALEVLATRKSSVSVQSEHVPDALAVLAIRKSPASVQSEHISQLMAIQVHDGFTDRPIRHEHTTRVFVERARTYPDEPLAA